MGDQKIRPGEFVMRVLFAEFTTQAEKKIETVMVEPPERSLSKSLQRGEDLAFDQLLIALGSVSEHCLPSILRTLFAWYDRQAITWLGSPLASGSISSGTNSSLTSSIDSIEKDNVHVSLEPNVAERRDMAVEFIFCLVLIEVLKQLPFHPGHHDLVAKIEDLAFAHFKYREGTGVNAANSLVIADLYAEVLGVLAQARFGSVRVRFLNELTELRLKEPTASITQSIISLLMGMKFFRIKMAPIEDFEASFQFLTECAKYFLEVKQRDIKHALAGLFVEILVPVAAAVKHEVNVPCLKSFVEMLYAPTLDMCTRSKHRLALFPLVTCLLCVSQRPFFLHNWHYFLAMCLSQLKSREPKMSRVALESLYRLLWAYMIRIKCESNSATQSRLLSVVNSLFPKGSKGVVPRDTPLNIFVKIIQFIAQERLDFAMREIVFELLSVGRPIKIILAPERMNIGLRAFLVAADALQQKDGDPPMPRSAGIMPSGNTLLRVKKTFLNKVLTEDTARSIGMASYFPLIRKVFTDILRALDLQCGRPLMLTCLKEQEEGSVLTGDRKAKIDLFRTCVAAIPRLIPEGMSRTELLSLLSRLTLHVDEELRGLAFQSLQSVLMDFPDWRTDVLVEFINFVSKEVPDTSPQQLDNALRMLLQLLTCWRSSASPSQPVSTTNNINSSSSHPNNPNNTNNQNSAHHHHANNIQQHDTPVSSYGQQQKSRRTHQPSGGSSSNNSQSSSSVSNLVTIYQAEGLGLLMLCSVRSSTRRLGAHMLKEIKGLGEVLGINETPVIDVLDKMCPIACEKVSNILPAGEKQAVTTAIATNSLDLQWITERSCPAWYTQEDDAGGGAGSSAASATSNANNANNSSSSQQSSSSSSLHHHNFSTHSSHSSSSHSSHSQSLMSSTSLLLSSANSLLLHTSTSTLSTDVSITHDPWASCLKIFLDYSNGVPTKCPRAILEAWSILMPKLTTLYTYLDPTPVADTRASLLRGTATTRKPLTDRNLYLKLWRNYLLFAFRTVPTNISVSIRCISPDMGISSSPEAPDGREGRSPLPLSSALLFSISPTSLYKQILPLIRNETPDIRELAVLSLGHCNHMAIKDVFEEFAPYLREACDRKQENVRRRKRKDNLRLQILKILEMMAEEKTFGHIPSTTSLCDTPCSGHSLGSHNDSSLLPAPLIEFLDNCKPWLELETTGDREGGLEMRIHFCKTIYFLLNSFHNIDLRENLLKKEVRKQLFHLCISWAGPYSNCWSSKEMGGSGGGGMTAGGVSGTNTGSGSGNVSAGVLGGGVSHSGNYTNANHSSSMGNLSQSQQQHQLDFAALQAASSLLTCGPCFQQSLLSEESHSSLYPWLDFLLSSSDPDVSDIGEEVVIMLLEFNPDCGSLLDWVVSRCFTGASQIADACFRAIATIFSAREYPCDRYVAIINVALLYSGCPKFGLQQSAFRLLQILDKRFFGELPSLQTIAQTSQSHEEPNTLDALLGRLPYAKNQSFLSKQLSLLHPELTMPMFSEISWRMKSARPDVRQSLLQYLQPWLHNMELVEPGIPAPNMMAPLKVLDFEGVCDNIQESFSSSSSCSLCGRKYGDLDPDGRLVRQGWGSTEATEMVLNNLLYLTAKFGEEHEREIEECWQTLCCSSVNNQRVLLYYLLIVTILAPNEILPHAKRVIIYLFRTRPGKLLEDLMAELQTVESLNWLVERTEIPPFYRLSHLRKTSSYSETNMVNGNIGGVGINNATGASNYANTSAQQHSNKSGAGGNGNTELLEKGTIHTKRRSAEESSVFQNQHANPHSASHQHQGPPHCRSSSSGTANLFRTEKIRTISGPAALPDTQFLASEKARYERDKENSGLNHCSLQQQLQPGDHNNSNTSGKLDYYDKLEKDKCNRYPNGSSETIAVNSLTNEQSDQKMSSGYLLSDYMNMNHDNDNAGDGLVSKLVPLPMPEYGGYYAPLKEFLPPQPVASFHRSNIALMFITEIVNEGTTITLTSEDVSNGQRRGEKDKKLEWCSFYLAMVVHMAFLGLDHVRPMVHLHGYNILINLLIVAGAHKDHFTIAKILLNQQTNSNNINIQRIKDANLGLYAPAGGQQLPTYDFLDSNTEFSTTKSPNGSGHQNHHHHSQGHGSGTKTPMDNTLGVMLNNSNSSSSRSREISPSQSPKSANSPRTPSRRPHTPVNLLLVIPDSCNNLNAKRDLTIEELIVSFIKFLAENRSKGPLWSCEDITARLWNIRSANQLSSLLQSALKVFSHSYPSSNLERKWATISLQIGLACSSRHYAGRSLQVYRALRVPLISRVLCEILSRLVETVAEPGDDMQGYVTELILTLEASVDAITIGGKNQQAQQQQQQQQQQHSSNNESNSVVEPCSESSSSKPQAVNENANDALSPTTSNQSTQTAHQMRARSGTDSFVEAKRPELIRSRSVQSLTGIGLESVIGEQDLIGDKLLNSDIASSDVIPQVFWLAISLLESDYEHEYLLALGLLEKVMERLPLDRFECRDKVERVQSQLQWTSFPGIIPLILKGSTNPNTYEQSLSSLCRFIPVLDFNFVDPTCETGFPLAVMALLPHLLSHYDDPTPMCLQAAQLIAVAGAERGEDGNQALQHLSTVMTLYSRRSFSKESLQWTKCVVKYLYDSYSHLAALLLSFLLDVLEKGPTSVQPAILAALYCSFTYVDLTSVGTVSPELLRAIEKHLEGQHWRESLRILKLVVTRSSSLVAPPPPLSSHSGSSGPSSIMWDTVSTTSSVAFSSDVEFSKKELPGRTMEFTFDVSQTPVIGRRHLNTNTTGNTTSSNMRDESGMKFNSSSNYQNQGYGLNQRSGSVGEMVLGFNGGNSAGGNSSVIIQASWKRPWQCQSRVRECLISVLNACGQRVGLPKSPSVIFSQSSELLERQSSVASSTEEVSVAINDVSGASRLEDGSTSDAHFRVFRDFDFLEYELESVEGETNDNFNWGVRRRPLSEIGTEPETEGEADETIMSKSLSRSSQNHSQLIHHHQQQQQQQQQSSSSQNTMTGQKSISTTANSNPTTTTSGSSNNSGYPHHGREFNDNNRSINNTNDNNGDQANNSINDRSSDTQLMEQYSDLTNPEESSDEEDLGLSPLEDVSPQLVGSPQPMLLLPDAEVEDSEPATPQPMSLNMIDSTNETDLVLSSSSPTTNNRSRSRTTRRNSDTSLDSSSDDETTTTTPCNISPLQTMSHEQTVENEAETTTDTTPTTIISHEEESKENNEEISSSSSTNNTTITDNFIFSHPELNLNPDDGDLV